MANAAAAGELKATQKLYGSFWKVSTTATAAKNGKEAIALSLTNLAEALDRNMTPTLLTSYAASLEDLTQEEIIQAFSRAHDELRFFPAPAILREFSGRPVTGDPIAAEAREEFQRILVAMRGKHGPKLRPILGRVLNGTADGLGILFGNRPWAGSLVTGLLLVFGLGSGMFRIVARLKKTAREGTVAKYENQQFRQQARYGHNVAGRAAKHGSEQK